MVRVLWFIHQPDRVAQNASNVSSADWQHQTHLKNSLTDIFSHVLLQLFSGLEILV